jgi:hypothetical protein
MALPQEAQARQYFFTHVSGKRFFQKRRFTLFPRIDIVAVEFSGPQNRKGFFNSRFTNGLLQSEILGEPFFFRFGHWVAPAIEAPIAASCGGPSQ